MVSVVLHTQVSVQLLPFAVRCSRDLLTTKAAMIIWRTFAVLGTFLVLGDIGTRHAMRDVTREDMSKHLQAEAGVVCQGDSAPPISSPSGGEFKQDSWVYSHPRVSSSRPGAVFERKLNSCPRATTARKEC